MSNLFIQGPEITAKCGYCHFWNPKFTECMIGKHREYRKDSEYCSNFSPEIEDKSIHWIHPRTNAEKDRVSKEFDQNGSVAKACVNCKMFPCGANKNIETEFCKEFSPLIVRIGEKKISYRSVHSGQKIDRIISDNFKE